MAGTLAVTRAVNNHAHYERRLTELGFGKVTVTAKEKDGLNSVIYEKKPDLLLIDARFYQCATPYMLGVIHKHFPKLNIAAVCIGEYPAELAMYFMLNGVKSYVSTFDGIEQFYQGIDDIRDGREYVPASVQKRIDNRHTYPAAAKSLTPVTLEVCRCICNGLNKDEIGDSLSISPRTVEFHRKEIYRSLNVRNKASLIIAAMSIGIISREELVFRHRNFVCTPLPYSTPGE